MNIDFIYRGRPYAVIFGVVNWVEGKPDTLTLTNVWDDEWAVERLKDYLLSEMNNNLEKKRKASERRFLRKDFDGESYNRDEVLAMAVNAFTRVKNMVMGEAKSLQNIEVGQGRDVKK